MAESPKNIVIIGASYGGLSTAHYLLKHAFPSLPHKESYKLILISSSAQVFDRPAAPRAVISDSTLDQKKLFVEIAPLFEQYPKENFRFVNGTVTTVDHVSRTVSLNFADEKTEMLSFHALVIATGSTTPSPLLSLGQDEKYIRARWAEFREVLPAAKSIIIVGAGPAGIEIAGELGEHLNGYSSWFSRKPATPKVNITVITAGPRILPLLRENIAVKAEPVLARLGVKILKNTRVKSVEPSTAGTRSIGSKAVVVLEDGTRMEADLYIPATGMKPNASFISKDLLTPSGTIETNPSTLRVDKAGPRIYAVGDVASTARPAVHLTTNAIPVIGANIKRDLLLEAGEAEASVGEDRIYKEDKTETHIVPIGSKYGVGAAMGWTLPSFMVWLLKGRDYWLWTTGDLWSGKQWNKAS